MPRLPDRLLPSHLGAGAQSERANRGWSPPLAAGAGSGSRGFPRWPRCRSRSAAGAPAVRPPRARALPSGGLGASNFPQGCDWTAPAGGAGLGGAGRGGAASERSRHVTGANMAAPSGVHLLVRRGKRLEDSLGGFAPSLTRCELGFKGIHARAKTSRRTRMYFQFSETRRHTR